MCVKIHVLIVYPCCSDEIQKVVPLATEHIIGQLATYSESQYKLAMANDDVVDDKSRIVTKFLVDTCRLQHTSQHCIPVSYTHLTLPTKRIV